MHGDLILPSMYRKRLMGATVTMEFSLTHWAIGGNRGGRDAHDPEKTKIDVYVAELQHMRVLMPPKPCPVTPRKRKVSAIDPSNSPSPSKRQRATSMLAK